MISSLGIFLFLVIPFYLLIWLLNGIRKSSISSQEHSDTNQPISLIIPFRNEEHRIKPLIESLEKLHLIEGDEVILVDDFSSDNGLVAFGSMRKEIRVLKLNPASGGSKKAALKKGILESQNNWIVTTDADCWFDADFIDTWRKHCLTDISMGIGMVITETKSLNFSSILEHAENRCLQTISMASAGNGNALMSSGANLLINKKQWEHVGGYSAHESKASGDDVLLMRSFQQVSSQSIRFVYGKGNLVHTHSVSGWKEWFVQRRRWASKTSHLSNLNQQVHAVLLLVWLVLFPIGIWVIGPAYGFMIIPEMFLIREVIHSSGGNFVWVFWPIFRMLYPILLVIIPFTKLLWPSEWKSRSFLI